MKPIELERYQNIVVLTGAGISVASGLRPYRGPGGLWETMDTSRAEAEAITKDPHGVWQLFGPMRTEVLAAQPNPAHLALAAWEERCQGRSFLLITQNVDGLHQQAGSQNVAEIHGNLMQTTCSSPDCKLAPFDDTATHAEECPRCPQCQAALRPDIVLFGEHLPVDTEWRVKKALRDCDLFLAVGTSGTVAPASSYVRGAAYANARTILVNLTPMEPRNPYFQEEYIGPAEELLPQLLS